MHQTSRSKHPKRLRQRLERFQEKCQEEGVKHPLRSSLSFLCVAGVVLSGAVTAASCTFCYQVESQGQSLAFFQDETIYDQALTQAESRTSKILQTTYTLNVEDLSVSTTLAPRDQVTNLSGVTGSIMDAIPELDHVYTLTVDGQMVGAAAEGETITQALNLVKEHYTTPETRSLYIVNQVDVRYEYLPAGVQLVTAEELAQTLLAASPRTFPYTVQSGDTLESVTERFGMTEERFRELNPDLTLESEIVLNTGDAQDDYPEGAEPAQTETEAPAGDPGQATDPAAAETSGTAEAQQEKVDWEELLGDQLRTPLPEGTEITIEQNCPLLEVTTVEEMDVNRELAPTLEVQEDDTMFVGQQRVIQEGEAGQAEVLARVVKRCGVPVASNDLSAVTLTEPTTLIVGTGTRELPELPDGCLFLWPVQGPITSEFGYRFIFGETNFHRGLDIAAPLGTAINAGADGTVIFAGEKGTYGNLVVLSHGNGFVTYYAHCSKILVEVGDTVTQGQPIAAVGSTGRSTGPHCHFEVRYENEPIDPLFYLPGENNAPARTQVDEEEAEEEEAAQEETAEEETQPPETAEEPTQPTQPPAADQPEQPALPEEPVQPETPALPEEPQQPVTNADPTIGAGQDPGTGTMVEAETPSP